MDGHANSHEDGHENSHEDGHADGHEAVSVISILIDAVLLYGTYNIGGEGGAHLEIPSVAGNSKQRVLKHFTTLATFLNFAKSEIPQVGSGQVLPDHTADYRNVQWFRGGLVFKVHRLLYHSTLGLTVITKERRHSGPEGFLE